MRLLAMDMGGTFIKWAYINKDNNNIKILEQGKYRTSEKEHPSGKDIVCGMAKFAQKMANQHKDIQCVCSTMVGIIDTDKYVVLSPNHTLKGYEGMHIRTEFAKYCKLPFYAINDVKAAARGELMFGSLKNTKHVNAIVLAIGTGIAGCPIINGEIYMGSTYASGECGQMVVGGHFYENHYSVPGLIKRCKAIIPSIITGEECLNYSRKNKQIKTIVDAWFVGLIEGFMNYIYLFNPSYIIFGGKITEYEYFDLKLVKMLMMKAAKKPVSSFEHVKLIKAKLGNNAALFGAASLAK